MLRPSLPTWEEALLSGHYYLSKGALLEWTPTNGSKYRFSASVRSMPLTVPKKIVVLSQGKEVLTRQISLEGKTTWNEELTLPKSTRRWYRVEIRGRESPFDRNEVVLASSNYLKI